MATRERAMELLQAIYYDSVDKGDMASAASAFTSDVDWSHQQVWAHHEYQSHPEATRLRGNAQLEAFLAERKEKLAEARIRHKVRHMVFDGEKGAFLGAVEGPGPEKPFMVWFEIRDDRVSRYELRPL